MYFQYVNSFIEVGRQLSFTKAADQLGLTQAAVSRQVKLLEETLGEQLLIRSPQKVILTPRGEKFWTMWSQFKNDLDSEFGEAATPTLKIGSVEGVLQNWLLPRVQKHFKENNINFELQVERTEELYHLLEDGKIDALLGPSQFENTQMRSYPLFEERHVLICAKGVLKSTKTKKELREEIEKCSLIFYSESNLLHQQMEKSHRYIQVTSMSAVFNLVRDGIGIAIVPEHTLPKKHDLDLHPWQTKTNSIFITIMKYDSPPEHLAHFINELTSPSI